nr:MAG TPA: hypothetical protein [Caudoviricetes sp.]
MENNWNDIEKSIVNSLAAMQLRISNKENLGILDSVYYETAVSGINELRSLSLTETDRCKCDALTSILEDNILLDLKELINFDSACNIKGVHARYFICKCMQESYDKLTQRNASISNLIDRSISLLKEALKLQFSNMVKEA